MPEDFRFAVKCHRAVTHDARLQDCDEALDRFTDEVGGLGAKLGAVLVQLPPSLKFDAAVAGSFFGMMRDRFSVAVVCEPRHPSWFEGEAEALLQQSRIARVAADPAKVGGDRPGGWPGLAYFRLHGSPRIYRSAYGARCPEIASQLAAIAETNRPAWCIFDNTASNAAIGDALRTSAEAARLILPGS